MAASLIDPKFIVETIAGLSLIGVPVALFFQHEKLATQLRVQKKSGESAILDLTTQLEKEVARSAGLSGELREARPALRIAEFFRARIKAMQEIWLNTAHLERPCQELLYQNMWVLLPDYECDAAFETTHGNFHMEKSISTIMRRLFDPSIVTDQEAQAIDYTYSRDRTDLCGWVRVKGNLQPNFARANDQIPVIVELKRPSHTICRDDMTQIQNYAMEIFSRARQSLDDKPLECFVIGGDVAPDLLECHYKIGFGSREAVRITPLKYQNLIDRAELLAKQFLRN